jgi:hypothetical protein
MNTLKIAGSAVALALLATSAQAGVKGVAIREGNFSNDGTAPILVPIKPGTGTAATNLSVKATKPTPVVITYSAECAVVALPADAPSTVVLRWMTVDILVDGVAISPTSGIGDAFCGATVSSPTLFEGYVRPSVSTTTVLSAGTHIIQVRAALGNGGGGWWLGDSALVVNN